MACFFLLLYLPAAVASTPGPDHFQTMCQRYLILEDPDFLERETTDDLNLLLPTLKARHHMYGHPLDRVMTKLIEHELWVRGAVKSNLRLVRD